MSRQVQIVFTSKKTHWESGFEAPENWDSYSDERKQELIEFWRQQQIDNFVTCDVEVL